MYALNVSADGPGGAADCGALGQGVTFKVEDRSMSPIVARDNNQLWEVPLTGCIVCICRRSSRIGEVT